MPYVPSPYHTGARRASLLGVQRPSQMPLALGSEQVDGLGWDKNPAQLKQLAAAFNKKIEWVQTVARGYAGWLMTNADFLAEHDALIAAWAPQIQQYGFPHVGFATVPQFQIPPGWGEADDKGRAFADAVETFLVRWRLQSLAAPGLPRPLGPQLPAGAHTMPDKTLDVTRERIGERVIIYKRKKRWWSEFYDGGQQHRKSLKTSSKKRAVAEAVRLEADLAAGRYETSIASTSIAAAVEMYLKHLAVENRAPATLKRYRSELERFGASARLNGAVRLDQITIPLVERFRAKRAEVVKPGTVYHESIVVKQLIKYAFTRGLVRSNVLDELKIRKPKVRRRRSYTPAEVEEILRVAKEPWRSVFELPAFSGLRIGELKFLSYDDVDVDGGWLHVRAKPDISWRPKNGEDRKVPLNERTRSVLERVPRVSRWVFWRRRTAGGTSVVDQIDERRVLKELKAVARELHIEGATVHGFRHFFITFTADLGVQPLQLMEWVGHHDLSVILTYYHLSDEESQKAMTSISPETSAGQGEGDPEQAQNEETVKMKKKQPESQDKPAQDVVRANRVNGGEGGIRTRG